MSWPFFIYNGEISKKRREQKLEKEQKEFWDKKLKDNPNFHLCTYDSDTIWNADNVMRVLKETKKRHIPVYKIELDKQIENVDGTHYWITKQIFVGYKDI